MNSMALTSMTICLYIILYCICLGIDIPMFNITPYWKWLHVFNKYQSFNIICWFKVSILRAHFDIDHHQGLLKSMITFINYFCNPLNHAPFWQGPWHVIWSLIMFFKTWNCFGRMWRNQGCQDQSMIPNLY